METSRSRMAAQAQGRCPFLEPAQSHWLYRVPGYCWGVPQGMLMIPTLAEYQSLCSGPGHTTCSIYRSRCGEGASEAGVFGHHRMEESTCAARDPGT